MNTTTPIKIDDTVLEFCLSVNSDNLPMFIPVIVETGAAIDECFGNVADKVAREGGERVFGWMIWLWPNTLIEGVFHSVWKNPNGSLIDITPKADHEKQILFLTDGSQLYEGRRVNNIRKSISTNGVVNDYILTSDALYYHMLQGDKGVDRRVSFEGEGLEILKWLKNQIDNLYGMIINDNGKHGPCPCGDGRSFKRCCRKELQEGIRILRAKYKF